MAPVRNGQKLFFAGIPTEPDVKRLEETFGVPEEGKLISWDSIAEAIRENRNGHRFRTVVGAWRRKLHRGHNVVMDAVAGEGIVAVDPAQRVGLGARRMDHGFRAIRRAGTVLEGTDRSRLDGEQKSALDHNLRIGAAAKMAAAMESRRIKGTASVVKEVSEGRK